MKEITNDNIYKPTVAEKKLLEVLINPEHLGKTITDICEVANISRFKYYDAMKKEGFSELVNKTTMDILKNKVSDVLNATYLNSITPQGHQDRKLLLSMFGIYTDKQDINLNGNMNVSNPLGGLTTEELRKLIK